MLRSPEYFLSYVLLPEKGQDNFCHLMFLSIFRVRRVLFLTDKPNFAKSQLKCHHRSKNKTRRPPEPYKGQLYQVRSKWKQTWNFSSPKGKLSFKKGRLSKGKICYKWDKIHGTEDPGTSRVHSKCSFTPVKACSFHNSPGLRKFPWKTHRSSISTRAMASAIWFFKMSLHD